jgi:hypothetical protein
MTLQTLKVLLFLFKMFFISYFFTKDKLKLIKLFRKPSFKISLIFLNVS